MMPFYSARRPCSANLARLVLIASLLMSTLAACDGNNAQPVYPTSTPAADIADAMVTFRLTLPAPLAFGESISLTILDEVTGLAFNTQSTAMQAEDAQHYVVQLPFPVGSVIKYRYHRQGNSLVHEHLSDGRPVRYRLYHVEGPGIVEDSLSRWTDTIYISASGRIAGQIFDSSDGGPIPNLMVTAGGAQALTLADGSYLLEGLPPGTHNLVVYALDGSYTTYQQGALVAPDSTTPATIYLTPASMTAVTFTVSVPSDTPPDAPLRMAGNLLQFGNTFADLSGGVSTLASRMPILSRLPDGRFMISMTLPVGADLRYKYTLGDGLWNAEHDRGGNFQIRQLIVPANPIQIEERVESWHSGGMAPIQFNVQPPENTPPDEALSLQFNLGYGWLEPLPMWPHQNAQGLPTWHFTLLSPFHLSPSLQYRYCREDQCAAAGVANSLSTNPTSPSITFSDTQQVIDEYISAWAWLDTNGPATVPNIEIQDRGASFVAGIAFPPDYHPSWQSRLPTAISDANGLGINWLIFSPTWTFTRQSPPVLEISPNQDIPWPEAVSAILQARGLGLNVGLYPAPRFLEGETAWWASASRDFSWWVSWFECYGRFMIHHAELAAQTEAQALILGGDWVTPALPGGTLDDGTSSNTPQDTEARWRNLIQQVRARFNGQLIWALPYPQGIQNPPPFLDQFDQILVLWSAPLSAQPGASALEMSAEALRLFDQDLKPFQETFARPVILAVAYPSANGGSTGCVPTADGGCLQPGELGQPGFIDTSLSLNLGEQTAAYNAMLMAVNQRPWISGLVSMGYYPPVALQDFSTSVHGKPASGALWYWFPRLLGKIK